MRALQLGAADDGWTTVGPAYRWTLLSVNVNQHYETVGGSTMVQHFGTVDRATIGTADARWIKK